MQDNALAPVNPSEFAALRARVNALENLLREYMLRERETAILTFNHVETALKLERTKESRHKPVRQAAGD